MLPIKTPLKKFLSEFFQRVARKALERKMKIGMVAQITMAMSMEITMKPFCVNCRK